MFGTEEPPKPKDSALGARHGLRPFIDIKLDRNGKVMTRDVDDDEWDFASFEHPDLKFPGSQWAKWVLDIEHGSLGDMVEASEIDVKLTSSALNVLAKVNDVYVKDHEAVRQVS